MAQQQGIRRPPNLDCRTCPTAKSAQWRVLDEEQRAQLSEGKQTAVYGAGEVLFRQESPCHGIHCLASGSLVLRRLDAQGNSVLIDLIHEGQTVGYRSYYNSRRHAEQAEALEPSTVCLVPNATVDALLGSNTELGRAFAESLATDMKELEQAVLNGVSQPVRSRIARLLHLLLDRFGESDEAGRIALQLPFGRQEMAELLGVQRETVTRTLNAMQADDVLQASGRTLLIHDLDRLLDELEQE